MAVTPTIGAGYIQAVESLAAQINAGSSPVTSSDITDATTVGKAVLTAASTSAAQTAIGIAASTTSVAGIAKQSAKIAPATVPFADLSAAATAYNALLTALTTAGLMSAT